MVNEHEEKENIFTTSLSRPGTGLSSSSRPSSSGKLVLDNMLDEISAQGKSSLANSPSQRFNLADMHRHKPSRQESVADGQPDASLERSEDWMEDDVDYAFMAIEKEESCVSMEAVYRETELMRSPSRYRPSTSGSISRFNAGGAELHRTSADMESRLSSLKATTRSNLGDANERDEGGQVDLYHMPTGTTSSRPSTSKSIPRFSVDDCDDSIGGDSSKTIPTGAASRPSTSKSTEKNVAESSDDDSHTGQVHSTVEEDESSHNSPTDEDKDRLDRRASVPKHSGGRLQTYEESIAIPVPHFPRFYSESAPTSHRRSTLSMSSSASNLHPSVRTTTPQEHDGHTRRSAAPVSDDAEACSARSALEKKAPFSEHATSRETDEDNPRPRIEHTKQSPVKYSLDDSLNNSLMSLTPGNVGDCADDLLDEDETGVETYVSACHEMRTAPITKLIKGAEAGEEHVFLAHRGVGNRGTVGLAAFLGANTTFKAIDLEDNNIRAEGAEALFHVLSLTGRISDLNIAANDLSLSIKHVIKVLQPGQSIMKLDLTQTKLGDHLMPQLASAIESSDSLMELRLGNNKITDEGVANLFASLATNKSNLRVLFLDWNFLKDVTNLVTCLTTNTKLQSLSLKWNKIGSTGCKLLCTLLHSKTNTTLQNLDLTSNEIAECLQELLLTGNNLIGDEGALTLLSGITDMSPLLRLDLKDCGLRSTGRLPIELLAPEKQSPLDGVANVEFLREVCPELLGTLAPMKPTVTQKTITRTSVTKLVPTRTKSVPGDWVSDTKVKKPVEPRVKVLRQNTFVPSGSSPGSSGRLVSGTAAKPVSEKGVSVKSKRTSSASGK